ncbi:MAG: 30S ribosome-binding factor RbfA [Actinomycetota bacterium]|nr:30S ribosome-binding factor RbfA [Actinomycetota bacterium]
MRAYERTDRLNALLVQILADELERLDDERLGLVTVTGVETDRDLSQARVFVAAGITDQELVEILEEYRPRLQQAIGSQSRLRRVPPLVFVADDTVRSADRIESILRHLNEE